MGGGSGPNPSDVGESEVEVPRVLPVSGSGVQSPPRSHLEDLLWGLCGFQHPSLRLPHFLPLCQGTGRHDGVPESGSGGPDHCSMGPDVVSSCSGLAMC